jgi:hypothetical protein
MHCISSRLGASNWEGASLEHQKDDKFARESFTFRRMKPWQIWSMSAIVLVLVVVALLLW